jgi:hypothetical protein
MVAITTKQVAKDGFPILAILHDEEDEWQVLCETTQDPNDGLVYCLGCLFEKFPVIGEFAHIPRGHEAIRDSADDEWRIEKTEYDEE